MTSQKHTTEGFGFYYIPRSDLNPHGTYAIVEASDLGLPAAQRFHLAEVTGFGDGSPVKRKVPAQVHLFVSAPDLLEALKLVLQHGRIDNSEERMNVVSAAIAKATGQ